jgi:signal peptidase I
MTKVKDRARNAPTPARPTETGKAEAPARPPKKQKKHETSSEFVASIASVLVVGIFIITFCLQAFSIPSSSMEDTLLIGDHVFVDRVLEAPRTRWFPVIPYRNVKDGDIVVFLSPAEPGLYLVKRLIGVPGDRIRLRNGVVYRNGQRLDESSYVKRNDTYSAYRDEFPSVAAEGASVTSDWEQAMPAHVVDGELVVPPGSYFAMGDNRDVSYDSRYWGFIPRENLIGRPMFIYWSFETPANQYLRNGMDERLAFVGRMVIHFFDMTRWRRMFKLIS